MKRICAYLLVLVFVGFSLSGCYYYGAQKEMANAEGVLAQLKNAGGPMKASYEYCSAEAFLQISKGEFGESDYKHAKEFAAKSISAGQAGLAAVKK